MRQQLFRRAALDRLSSPEQLDHTLRLTGPRDWLMLLVVFLMLGGAVAWAWLGSVVTTVSGEAVLVRTGGVATVTAPGSGLLVALDVKPGDRIKANQIVARIAQPALTDQIRLAEEALSKGRSDAEQNVQRRSETLQLQTTSIERQRANLQREIEQLKEQSKFAAEQVSQQEQLLAYGLITKQPLVAAQQKQASNQADIARMQAQLIQLDAEQSVQESGVKQVAAEGESRVGELQRHLSSLRQQLAQEAVVVSPYAGEVVEIKSYRGAAVTLGAPLLSVQSERGRLEAIVYVPSQQAKLVEQGMAAQVSPSNARREVYGFISGKVASTAVYPSTRAALMRNFENENLVSALTTNGPVTELRVRLDPNPADPRDLRWSSVGTRQPAVSSGTLCKVLVVTTHHRPITLLVPMLRERLGLS